MNTLQITCNMHHTDRIDQNHLHTVFLAGKLRNIQSYTVYVYGSGQTYWPASCISNTRGKQYFPLLHSPIPQQCIVPR